MELAPIIGVLLLSAAISLQGCHIPGMQMYKPPWPLAKEALPCETHCKREHVDVAATEFQRIVNESCSMFVHECAYPELWLALWDLTDACEKLGAKHGAKGRMCYANGSLDLMWINGNRSIVWTDMCIKTVVEVLNKETMAFEDSLESGADDVNTFEREGKMFGPEDETHRWVEWIDNAIQYNFTQQIHGVNESHYCAFHNCQNDIRRNASTWFTATIEEKLGYLTDKSCACTNAPTLFGPFTKLEEEGALPPDENPVENPWNLALLQCIPINCTRDKPGTILKPFAAGLVCESSGFGRACNVDECCQAPKGFQQIALSGVNAGMPGVPTPEPRLRLYESDLLSGHRLYRRDLENIGNPKLFILPDGGWRYGYDKADGRHEPRPQKRSRRRLARYALVSVVATSIALLAFAALRTWRHRNRSNQAEFPDYGEDCEGNLLE